MFAFFLTFYNYNNMSRLKLQTLQAKVEFIILSLGGKPDQDTQENRRNLSEFEMTSVSIKETLNVCKDRLKERQEKIKLFGYSNCSLPINTII